MSNQIVAIDGPAAAGKSTVARALADELDALLFDTGALYRAVTLLALRSGARLSDGPALADLATTHVLQVTPPSIPDGRLYDVSLNGEDITWAIRDPAVDAAVSPVSAHPEVRAALLALQRRIASQGRVVIVGRDIGTVVVPNATVKVFLVASDEERARRRHRELVGRGVDTTLGDVLADLERRDRIDQDRDVAPLQAAEDAIVIETDHRSIGDIVAAIKVMAEQAWEPTVVGHVRAR
ncbi:MAG: (d)CMP kinase [Chloroflexota bacterium]|nr:(d)CMP kinase [Chloroflexota bacterium]